MKNVTVVVTGATAPGFVSIVRALKRSKHYKFEIVGTDYRLNPSSVAFADQTYVLPDNRSSEFAGALADKCEEVDAEVLLPIRTDDQMPICSNLQRFRNAGVEPAIVVTSPYLMDIILNKRKLMEYARDVIRVRVPKFEKAATAQELEEAVKRLGYPEKPVVVKPSLSNGSRGFRILDEHIDRRRMFFEEKPTGIYSTLTNVLADVGDTFPELLVMEYLPGDEYTVDVLCRKGITFQVLPRLRTKMTGGITTGGILARDERFDAIDHLSRSLVEGLGASYNLGLQVKCDVNGVPQMLEINPRLQGTTIISVEGGVNIPEMMVMMALREFDYEQEFNVKWGLRLQRVWLEVFEHEGRVWCIDEDTRDI